MQIFHKKSSSFHWLWCALYLFASNVQGDYRTWMPVQGQPYQAQLIWGTPTNALLQSSSKKFWVNLSALSDADKTFIKQETPRVTLDWWKNQQVVAQKEIEDSKAALDLIQATVNAFRTTARATSADSVLPNGRRFVVNSLNADSLVMEAKQRYAKAVKMNENVAAELTKATMVIEERQKTETEAQKNIDAAQDKVRAEAEARIGAKREVDEAAMAKVKAAEDKAIAAENAHREAEDAAARAQAEANAKAENAKAEALAAQEKAKREMVFRNTPGKPIGPKVKGLCIGMKVQDVPALLKKYLSGESWGVNRVFKHGEEDVSCGLSITLGGAELGAVIAGPDGRVDTIVFTSLVVNKLFNSNDMDASEFVHQFVKAYNIPEMKVSDDLKSWTYTSPEGVKVKIADDKSIFMEKVANAQERKRSFD